MFPLVGKSPETVKSTGEISDPKVGETTKFANQAKNRWMNDCVRMAEDINMW